MLEGLLSLAWNFSPPISRITHSTLMILSHRLLCWYKINFSYLKKIFFVCWPTNKLFYYFFSRECWDLMEQDLIWILFKVDCVGIVAQGRPPHNLVQIFIFCVNVRNNSMINVTNCTPGYWWLTVDFWRTKNICFLCNHVKFIFYRSTLCHRLCFYLRMA